jgi:nitrate/nitrite transport system ATP-binding protein
LAGEWFAEWVEKPELFETRIYADKTNSISPIVSAYCELFNLTKTYPTPKGPSVIVKDFTLRLAEGEFVTLIGHSGCGKSTVLSMLAGLNSITDGGIVLAGHELAGPGPDRGVVFQSPSLLPWMTAFENVMLGVNQVFSAATDQQRTQVVEYYLNVVGLRDSMHKRPAELSQGMRQRVGIARAFALKPKMLLLDEPFGMLDALTRHELQAVLLSLWRRNRITTLMVTHDVDEALYLSDRIVCMTDGPEAEVGDIVPVHFPRPRDRKVVMEDADYYRLRGHLIEFLEVHAHRRRTDRFVEPPTINPQSTRNEPTLSPSDEDYALSIIP